MYSVFGTGWNIQGNSQNTKLKFPHCRQKGTEHDLWPMDTSKSLAAMEHRSISSHFWQLPSGLNSDNNGDAVQHCNAKSIWSFSHTLSGHCTNLGFLLLVQRYSMWQYNVIVPFLRNETKTERPFPLYETPHLFRRNERTVLKRFVAEKRSQNDSSLNKTMKNHSLPFAAPSRPVATAPSRRCCYSFAPPTSLVTCERQKQQILPEAKGIRRA